MRSEEFRDRLNREVGSFREISVGEADQLLRHYELMTRWNRKVNLTGIRDLGEILERHYGESVFLAMHMPDGGLSIADVGSGAGFPGVPVAVLRPDCECTLIESRARKAVFLREATREMGNVRVFEGRGEECRIGFDWLISRAVAPKEVTKLMPRLAERVALLVGEEAAVGLRGGTRVRWEDPVRLPWGRRRVLLMGHSS